jgi:phosphoserine phosphatase
MAEDIALVCFDLNKTLIDDVTWLNLNLAMGMTPAEDEEFLHWYEEGKISYGEWQKFLEQIYKLRGKATLKNMVPVVEKYNYTEGAQEVAKYLKAKGYKLALVSGSVDLVVRKVARDLGVDLYGAHNSLIFDKEGVFKKIEFVGDDGNFKLAKLREFCKKLKIGLSQVVCVGDGYNDKKIFEATGHGVTFKGSVIEKEAWKVIGKLKDLETIL